MAPEVDLLSFSLNFPRAEKKKNKGSGGHFFTFPKRKKERKVETESLFVAALPRSIFFPSKRIGKVKKWNKVIVIERKNLSINYLSGDQSSLERHIEIFRVK